MRTARRRLLRAFLGLGVLALTLVPPAGSEDVEGPCMDDDARLCGDAGPTRVERMGCLKARAEDLSEGCRALLAEPQQRRDEANEACGDDAARLCSDVQPGRNRTGMQSCLRTNADSLSEACRNALDAFQNKKREGAPPGG